MYRAFRYVACQLMGMVLFVALPGICSVLAATQSIPTRSICSWICFPESTGQPPYKAVIATCQSDLVIPE